MSRIFHTWDRWECYPAGLYEDGFLGQDEDECRSRYAEFLADLHRFRAGLERVLRFWGNSCEHYLTNDKMNRIAWLGQAAACAAMGLPAKYRAGYFRMTEDQQRRADLLALEYLNKWLTARGLPPVDLEGAGVKPNFILGAI